MSYNFNVFSQQEQVEYQKFVQLDNDTRYPAAADAQVVANLNIIEAI